MKGLALVSFFLVLTCGLEARAQTLPPGNQDDFEHLIQQLFPVHDQEGDAPSDDFYEALFQYYMQPLDLNKASQEELQSLFILSESQIQSFFQHLQRSGKLLNIYEMQAIPGWDLNTAT